jgi:carbohydrate-selective porin OprB
VRNSARNICSATGWARAELADQGIKPLVLFITDPFVNASGGRRRGFSEYDLLALDLILETDKLLGWRGGEFRVGFANDSGTSLSQRYIGNNFPVQLADVADPNPRLTYLNYTQSLFDDKLSVRFGRLTLNSVYGEEFAGSQYFKAFSETDQTDDLKKIDVPTLLMQGDDDQIVPFADSGLLQSKIVKGAILKVYKGAPHGLCTTLKDQVNEDLLAFLKT